MAKEIETIMTLDHPNVVKLHAAYKDSSKYYIVMELCQGGTLLDMLTSGKQKFFADKDALRIMH